MKLAKMLNAKAMYLQQSFVTDDMLLSQLRHALEKRNLKQKEVNDLFMSY